MDILAVIGVVAGIFIGMIGVALVVVALGAILEGYVLTVLWGWFIIPIFHLPPLTIVPAIGIALVVGLLTYHSNPDVEEKKRTGWEQFALLMGKLFARPLVVLAFGWAVHKFM